MQAVAHISSTWKSQACLLSSCRVWSLHVNKQRSKVLFPCVLTLKRWSHFSFSSCLEWVWWAQYDSSTIPLCMMEGMHGPVGPCTWTCCRQVFDVCDTVGQDWGILSLRSCLSNLHQLSLDVLCCSFVYLNVLLRSQPFFPKKLKFLLKVVVFSATKSLAFPAHVCALLSREAGAEVPGAVDSQRKVLLLFQQTAALHHHSALICTQNKLQILGVKPWH